MMQTDRRIAKWRRKGGVWRIGLIVEGYDDEYVYVCSARLSEVFARQLARIETGKQLGESYKIVHIASAQREG